MRFEAVPAFDACCLKAGCCAPFVLASVINPPSPSFSCRQQRKQPLWKSTMDSDVIRDGIMIDVVDSKWREDKLPDEDIAVPLMELPDPEPDNSNVNETLREQEQKWTDLALNRVNDQPTSTMTN